MDEVFSEEVRCFFEKTDVKDKIYKLNGEVLGRMMVDSTGFRGVYKFSYVAKSPWDLAEFLKMSDGQVVKSELLEEISVEECRRRIFTQVTFVYSSPFDYLRERESFGK